MNPRIITAADRAARRKKWRGAGDVIAAVTKVIGIKPCVGCQSRQKKLNQFLPFLPRAPKGLVNPNAADTQRAAPSHGHAEKPV